MPKHLFNKSNEDENIDKSNDDEKEDPFSKILNFKNLQSSNSFGSIQDNNINVLNNNERDIKSGNNNEGENDLDNSSYIQLDLLGDTIHHNDLVDTNNEMLEKISETNRIDNLLSVAPTNYADFKHNIEKESQNFPLNPDYDFPDCNIDDEFLSQNGNLNDSSLLQYSLFHILQNDNNKNKIIENEPSPLLDQDSRNCENFLENFGNNSFKGENNTKHRENTFVNTEAKECFNGNFTTQKSDKNLKSTEKTDNSFHLAENNKSNQKKEKINGCDKSEKKIGNDSNEAYKKEIFEEKNNHNSIGYKDKKEQKIPQISKNNSSKTNFSTSKKSVNFFISNPKKTPFSQPTENAISNINLINMNFSGFSREENNINNQVEQNISPDKIIGKKTKRKKDEITENEREKKAKNNLNDLEKSNI